MSSLPKLPPDAPADAQALLEWARVGLALYIGAVATLGIRHADLIIAEVERPRCHCSAETVARVKAGGTCGGGGCPYGGDF